jgi:hypothetical protein
MWPFLVALLLPFVLSFALNGKRHGKYESLKWKIWFLLLPLYAGMFFIDFFVFSKDYFSYRAVDFLFWIGVTIVFWLYALMPIFYRIRERKIWWGSDWQSSGRIEDNISDHFDLAMKITKEKREGKDTSAKEKLYDIESDLLEKSDYDFEIRR